MLLYHSFCCLISVILVCSSCSICFTLTCVHSSNKSCLTFLSFFPLNTFNFHSENPKTDCQLLVHRSPLCSVTEKPVLFAVKEMTGNTAAKLLIEGQNKLTEIDYTMAMEAYTKKLETYDTNKHKAYSDLWAKYF